MTDIGLYRIHRDVRQQPLSLELVGIATFSGPKMAQWCCDVLDAILDFDGICNHSSRVLADYETSTHVYRMDRRNFNEQQPVTFFVTEALMPHQFVSLYTLPSANNEVWGSCVNLMLWAAKVQDYACMHPRVMLADAVKVVCAQIKREGVAF